VGIQREEFRRMSDRTEHEWFAAQPGCGAGDAHQPRVQRGAALTRLANDPGAGRFNISQHSLDCVGIGRIGTELQVESDVFRSA